MKITRQAILTPRNLHGKLYSLRENNSARKLTPRKLLGSIKKYSASKTYLSRFTVTDSLKVMTVITGRLSSATPNLFLFSITVVLFLYLLVLNLRLYHILILNNSSFSVLLIPCQWTWTKHTNNINRYRLNQIWRCNIFKLSALHDHLN
jgi:hypothetical protein